MRVLGLLELFEVTRTIRIIRGRSLLGSLVLFEGIRVIRIISAGVKA